MNSKLTFVNYFRSILGILLFTALFSLLIPIVSIIVVISLGKLTDWVLEKVSPLLARFILWILGINYRIKYHQTKLEDGTILTGNVHTPAIYIVNHASTLDILTILALAIQRAIRGKMGNAILPFFFLLGRLTGQIFIKRGDREKAIQTLQKLEVQKSPLYFNCTRRNTKTRNANWPFQKRCISHGTRFKLSNHTHLL